MSVTNDHHIPTPAEASCDVPAEPYRLATEIWQAWNDSRVTACWEFPTGEPDTQTLALSIFGLIAHLQMQLALLQAGRESNILPVDSDNRDFENGASR